MDRDSHVEHLSGCRSRQKLSSVGGGTQTATQRRHIGPVERKVRADIRALITAHPMGEALSEMSYNLARVLDDGAGLAVAAVNRELRANLAELGRLADDGNDDLADELSDPELPSQVRDPEEP
jgi:hypothetical protein